MDERQQGIERALKDLRTPLYGLFILGVLYTLYLARELLLPITLAGLVSLLLAPAVAGLARRGLHRALGALVLLFAVVGGVAGLASAVVGPMFGWLEQAPEALDSLTADDALREIYRRMTRSARQVEATVEELAAEDEPTRVVLESESWREQFLLNARNNVVALALALALCYFLLVSGNGLITNIAAQFPSRARRRMFLRVIRDCQREIARYLAVITVSNSTVGLLTAVLVAVVGLPTPAVWGVFAALLRFVPYLGVVLATLLLAIVSANTLHEPALILVAPLGFLVLNSVVGFFLEPFIHGYRMSVNPIVIFLAIFFWGWLWGAIGVLLAVPLMTVIQVVLRQVDRLRPVYRVVARGPSPP